MAANTDILIDENRLRFAARRIDLEDVGSNAVRQFLDTTTPDLEINPKQDFVQVRIKGKDAVSLEGGSGKLQAGTGGVAASGPNVLLSATSAVILDSNDKVHLSGTTVTIYGVTAQIDAAGSIKLHAKELRLAGKLMGDAPGEDVVLAVDKSTPLPSTVVSAHRGYIKDDPASEVGLLAEIARLRTELWAIKQLLFREVLPRLEKGP